MNVAIVGAGLIGKKRAAVLGSSKLVMVADTDKKRASELAQAYRAEATDDWKKCISNPQINAVIVATPNDVLSKVTVAALETGKNVLVEKPGGKNTADLDAILAASKKSNAVVRVGFNHRFHPGLQRAKKLVQSASSGPLMYFRARYGHGGRLGYEKEWRAMPAVSGGGELLDQGVHLIDLCRWIGGEFELEYGTAKTFFWNMQVDDNGFLFLKSPDGARNAFLHASCTEWKNLFDFEIFCQNAKIEVFGLGRSYGEEECRLFQMKPEMGPPDVKVEKFSGDDVSWENEWKAFVDETEGKRTDIATIEDAAKAMQIVSEVYRTSKLGDGRKKHV